MNVNAIFFKGGRSVSRATEVPPERLPRCGKCGKKGSPLVHEALDLDPGNTMSFSVPASTITTPRSSPPSTRSSSR